MIDLSSVNRDQVIKSSVSPGKTTYAYALEHLAPLIDKFEEQRKVQRKKFYERLRTDIVAGCIMPPLTLAFVDKEMASNLDLKAVTAWLLHNIDSGYILDGMQRLNTLKDAATVEGFDPKNPLFLNVIIAERYDLLLYRMITLNNGQKPMTARHQIEMLTKGMLDTENLKIAIVSEKDTEVVKPQGAFRRADISAAYTAFLTSSVHNENARIIESKLDEILVGKVMDSDLVNSKVSFHNILSIVDKFSLDNRGRDWLRLGNNLIGFSVGAKESYADLLKIDEKTFSEATETFETSFSALDVSKINVGKFRRELSRKFIANIGHYADIDSESLTSDFIEATLVD